MTRTYKIRDPLGKWVNVLEVYESFSGWYWFITEKEKIPCEAIDGSFGFVAYGLVRGNETEWGEIWMPEVEAEIKRGRAWKVPEENYIGLPFGKWVE